MRALAEAAGRTRRLLRRDMAAGDACAGGPCGPWRCSACFAGVTNDAAPSRHHAASRLLTGSGRRPSPPAGHERHHPDQRARADEIGAMGRLATGLQGSPDRQKKAADEAAAAEGRCKNPARPGVSTTITRDFEIDDRRRSSRSSHRPSGELEVSAGTLTPRMPIVRRKARYRGSRAALRRGFHQCAVGRLRHRRGWRRRLPRSPGRCRIRRASPAEAVEAGAKRPMIRVGEAWRRRAAPDRRCGGN